MFVVDYFKVHFICPGNNSVRIILIPLDVSAKSTGLKKRKSFLVQCVRGAQWRLELITGVQNQIQGSLGNFQ